MHVTDASSNEPITDEGDSRKVSYGWQFVRVNGLPVSSNEVARQVNIDTKTGELRLNNLHSQSKENRTQGKCVVRIVQPDNATGDSETKLYGGKFFFVNVPASDELVSTETDGKWIRLPVLGYFKEIINDFTITFVHRTDDN